MRSINHGEVPTYPMLWAHSADRDPPVRGVVQTRAEIPRPDDESRAIERWNLARRPACTPTLDFQLNSTEPRHVPHAGEVPRRQGLAEHRPRRRTSRDPTAAVVQFYIGPANALVEGHAPANGASRT